MFIFVGEKDEIQFSISILNVDLINWEKLIRLLSKKNQTLLSLLPCSLTFRFLF